MQVRQTWGIERREVAIRKLAMHDAHGLLREIPLVEVVDADPNDEQFSDDEERDYPAREEIPTRQSSALSASDNPSGSASLMISINVDPK